VTLRSLGLVFGTLYLGVGALGLMPGALGSLSPTNPTLGVVHLAMGAWALSVYTGRAHPLFFARSAAFIFAGLGLAGMLHGVDHGAVVWVHLASAGVAGFIGWRPGNGERRSLIGDRRRRIAPVPIERRHALEDRRAAAWSAVRP
jgi:hypothetical protein